MLPSADVALHDFSLLIAPHSRRILVATSDRHHLPTVQVPDGRVANLLTEAIESLYGISAVQLALLPRESGTLAVLEVISSADQSSALIEVDFGRIAERDLREDERSTVRAILEGNHTSQGRFARLGWVDELRQRIEPYLSQRNQKLTGLVRHVNCGIDFSLLWLQTDSGPDLWFKAVGEPNTREFAITLELARLFPERLPHIVCAVPEWNGWLAEDVEGAPLNAAGDTAARHALRALAGMQQMAIQHVPTLRMLGAVDWPLSRLLSLQREFFAAMPAIMAAQTSTRSRPLAASELRVLQASVLETVAEFEAIGIPDTLVHGDIGHGNVKMTDRGPIFLDWAETYIGHPFLTAEHLLVDLERSAPNWTREKCAVLHDEYLCEWKGYAAEQDLATAARLMPAMAAFTYAIIVWNLSRTRPEPERMWPLLRSLVRRMQTELHLASGVAA